MHIRPSGLIELVPTHIVERALAGILDHQFILLVDLLSSESCSGSNLPVLRIILPKNGAESKTSCDGTNAVINVAERGLEYYFLRK